MGHCLKWVTDSGSSNHLTGDLGVLHDYIEYAVPKPLRIVDSIEAAFMAGEGTVCVKATFGLKHVGYVPTLTHNCFPMVARSRQKLALTMNPKGEFVSMNQA
jgi:hypothetical protein